MGNAYPEASASPSGINSELSGAEFAPLQMYSYQKWYPHDRGKTLNVAWRRLFVISAIFLTFSLVLLLGSHQRRWRTPLRDNGFIGAAGSVPGVKYNAEEKWSPPPDWDPVNPVWENFTR